MNRIDEINKVPPRIVPLIGEVTTETAMNTIFKLQELNSISHDPIILEINSPGGSVGDGLALIDIMESIESPVYTVALAQASSMASLILAAGKKRKANKHCRMLLHQMQIGCSGKFNDISEAYKSTNKLNDAVYELYAKYTGKDKEYLKSRMQNDLILDGFEAKEFGLIDEVL